MKFFFYNALFLSLLLLLPLGISTRHIGLQHSRQRHHHGSLHGVVGKQRGVDTVQVVGSRLPDCSHACGSCSPCRLVMVSFVCASIAEAETCPMAYKCMCKNKSYPVP